jgi:carbamoyl-phosphate synthase large subunit
MEYARAVRESPAAVMTRSEAGFLEIIEREKPDALLPTLGGQTGLNVSVALYELGVLAKYGVQMIGAKYEAIKKGEDRNLFKKSMERIGLDLPRSGLAYSLSEALEVAKEIARHMNGYKVVVVKSTVPVGTCRRFKTN